MASVPVRDPNNVAQNNEVLTLNGHPVYELDRVKDLMLRTSAATLLIFTLLTWCMTFKNKRSAVSILVAAFIFTELAGVCVGLLPKIQMLPNSPVLSVGVGVGCFLFSSECFNWVLYVRFSIVSPFARRLRIATLLWLSIETVLVGANYLYWIQQAFTEDGDTKKANDLYYYLSIVQACTAAYLSTYFVATYYYPRLKLTRKGASLIAQFFTTGLLYLILETVLHTSYTVTSNLFPKLRSGITAFLTAIRYGIFMLFVLALRSEMNRSQGSYPKLAIPPLGGSDGLKNRLVIRAGVAADPKGTFDDWTIDAGTDDPEMQAPPPSSAAGGRYTKERI